MLEVIVAITLIGIVMTALTTFFATIVSITSRQSGQQAAVQLADDGTERVRALRGSAVVAGRDKTSTDTQWASPLASAAPYLADMRETWDATATFPAGASAPLPTTAKYVTINGISYGQNWYVGKCWQPLAGGDCGATQTAGFVEFFRVVVAVAWSERHCPGSTCSYVTSTLVSGASGEPLFNSNPTAHSPVVSNPGNQSGEVSVAASLQLTASAGAPPLTWSASGLPAGLSISSDGLISGTPTTAGTYPVTAQATDAFGLVGSAAFTWTIKALPQLTSPGDQTTASGTAVSLAIPVSGGTGPLAWSVTKPGPWGASGLPPGLSIDPSTGLISGTPTTAGPASPVTVTVTDALGKSGSTTFSWTIVPPLQLQTPASQTGEVGAAITALQLTATGGIAPYKSWSVTGLPPGLSIDATGRITGSPTTAGTYASVVVTVTDSASKTASTSAFRWTIVAAPQITAPTTSARNNVNGDAISLQATVTGGISPYTWTATNLPGGLTISPAGLISGTATAPGSYATTVNLTDGAGGATAVSFTWNVLGITSPTGNRTDSVNQKITNVNPVVVGGSGSYTWSQSGLPPGLSFRTRDGRISGTPTSSGTYNVTLTVTDSDTSLSASVTFTWTIQ